MFKTKESFLEVLESNRRIIFKVVNTYCKNPADREDLVQEVIVQLWSSFDKYNEEFKISTWIYRIALNVAISFYRRSSSRSKYETPLGEQFIEVAEEDTSDTEEKLDLLRQFIDRLDEMNKALMILYLDGNSHEEIAHILNISVSNVGTKISRIKKNLKQQINKTSL